MQFILTIKLGNEAMQTPADVAERLHKIASTIDGNYDTATADHGRVLDLNGNVVGRWEFGEEDRNDRP